MLRNNDRTYGFISRFFHWAIAFLILCLLSMGFWMESLEYSPFKGAVYGVHKSFGMIVLVLAALRILWKSFTPRPLHLATHAGWEIMLAQLIHGLLYAAMILMPLSGWVMSSAGQHAVTFFGLFNVPPIVPASETIARLAYNVHGLTAYALLLGVGLHYAGALKHHVIDRDETLRRMGGNLLVAAIGALLIAAPFAIIGKLAWDDMQARSSSVSTPVPTSASASASNEQEDIRENALENETSAEDEQAAAFLQDDPAVAGSLSVPAAAPFWTIDPAASAVGVEFIQYGQGVKAGFGAPEGVIRFDPDNPESGIADIRVQVSAIASGDSGRDEQARGAEWFDAARYPVIHFVSAGFARTDGDNAYTARGSLTIRDVTQDIVFPFTLDIQGEKALMQASFDLNRLDFGVGQGAWAAEDVIENTVKITISLEAERE